MMEHVVTKNILPGSFFTQPLKIYHPKREVVFQLSLFRGYLKLRECIRFVFCIQYLPEVSGRNSEVVFFVVGVDAHCFHVFIVGNVSVTYEGFLTIPWSILTGTAMEAGSYGNPKLSVRGS